MSKVDTSRSHSLGVMFGVLAALAFAAYLSLNRYVYTHYHVNVFDYITTFLIAGGSFAAISLLISRRQQLVSSPKHIPPMALNGLAGGAAMGLLVLGQRYTTAVNASIIMVATVIPTMVFSRLMLKESFSRKQLLWLVVMFGGLYLAIVGAHFLNFNRGDLIILTSLAFFGFANAFSKVLMKHSSSDVVADVRLATGGVIFACLGLLISGTDFLVTSAGLWPVLAGFAFWLTIRFFYASIHHINPNRAVVLSNCHPIITPVVGVLLLHEPYSWAKAIGSAMLLISVYKIAKK